MAKKKAAKHPSSPMAKKKAAKHPSSPTVKKKAAKHASSPMVKKKAAKHASSPTNRTLDTACVRVLRGSPNKPLTPREVWDKLKPEHQDAMLNAMLKDRFSSLSDRGTVAPAARGRFTAAASAAGVADPEQTIPVLLCRRPGAFLSKEQIRDLLASEDGNDLPLPVVGLALARLADDLGVIRRDPASTDRFASGNCPP
jgi:hypothetical protein